MVRVTKIVCPYKNCSAIFTRSDRYRSHVRFHTGEKPYVCSHDGCVKSYTRADYLKRHEETHGNTYIRCPVKGCTLLLKTKKNLKRHVDKIHKQKNKSYKCEHCEKEFNKHSNLKIHKSKHANVLLYVCSKTDCLRGFTTPTRLRRHMKIHDGYPCTKPDCKEIFLTWSLLVKHIAVSHPTIHKCSECEKEFDRSSNLIEHKKVHSLEKTVFCCTMPNCQRFYYAKRNLSSHMKDYHDARPFKCEENCYKEFKTMEELNAHKRYHNPNVPLPHKKGRSKKSHTSAKPTLSEILAGCVESKTIEKKTVLDGAICQLSQISSVDDKIVTAEKIEISSAPEIDVSNVNHYFPHPTEISADADAISNSVIDGREINSF